MFPVATVSEVEGHAFFKGVDSHRAVSNVQLQLIAADDTVIASAKTEYDGYFFMEKVPPGSYRLRIDPEQAAKLGIQLARDVPVKAKADGGLVGGLVLDIVRGGAATAATQ